MSQSGYQTLDSWCPLAGLDCCLFIANKRLNFAEGPLVKGQFRETCLALTECRKTLPPFANRFPSQASDRIKPRVPVLNELPKAGSTSSAISES